MTKPGRRITVSRSLVTGIRIDSSGFLTVEGVDQDKAGNTLRSHSLTFAVDDGRDTSADRPFLTPDVAAAIKKVAKFAQTAIDDA